MDLGLSDTDDIAVPTDMRSGSGSASRRAGRKLALIVAILMVPLFLLSYFLARSSLEQVRSAERSASGIVSLRQLSPVFFSLAWNNEAALTWSVERVLENKLPAQFSGKFNASLAQLLTNTREPSFDRQQLLSETRDLLRQIASETGLLQDDVVARHFLADALVKQLPDLVVLAHAGTATASLEQFSGEFTALQNAVFEDISTAIRADVSGTFQEALNFQLAGLDERLESYRAATATPGRDDDKLAYEALLTGSAEFMTSSTAVMENDIRSDNAAKLRAFTIIALTCGLAALAAMIFAARMFYSTFHKLDDVELAYHKLEKSESEAKMLAGQLTVMNQDVALLNKGLAENFRILKETQDDNIKKSKLAQIGSVTAMVAHELRNPLGAVRNSIFLIEKKAGHVGMDIARPAERINNAVVRCDNIISQLLEFTSARPLSPVVTGVDDWVVKTVESVAGEFAAQVVVTCDLGLGAMTAVIDTDAMARALRAVLRNAAQALVPGSVSSDRPADVLVQTRWTTNGVSVAIRDTGPGIPPDHLGKVLEPLFTTKSFGPGLGLPVASRIVEQHGGSLKVESDGLSGTTVTFLIPSNSPLSAVA